MDGIERVAVIGTGVIGSAWVSLFAQKGYRVTAYSRRPETREKGYQQVCSNLDFFVEKGVLTKEDRNQAVERVRFVSEIKEAVSDAHFIEECSGETYEIKKPVFEEIDRHAPASTIIGSSSSGLCMSEIQQSVKHKDRCVITHPWNPPHLIPLIEIVPGRDTSDATVKTSIRFMEHLGKIPVLVKKEVPGFIGNRLAVALWREAIDLVENGVASVEDVDKALYAGPGLRWALMGSHMIYHLGGGEDGGVGHFIDGIGNTTFKAIWEELTTWNYITEPMKEKLIEGIKEEMKGRSFKDFVKWRDDKIFELIKLVYGG
ncbi:MAG TPA: 3-hydroxyacyl-CoA dehydrogenase NAD-binding domain-containing protein [Desulfomonilia bacterium]